MKTMSALFALLAALPLAAQEPDAKRLTVNAAPTEETWGEVVATLDAPVATAAGETAVLDATMTFSRPTEALGQPDAADILTLAVDADGVVKVSDGTVWKATAAQVPKEGEVTWPVRIVATSDGSALSFHVNVNGTGDVSVAASAAATRIGSLLFDGEGSVTGVAVAAVSVGILPPAAVGGAQDVGMVEAYAAWARDAEKGGAMASASDAEKADAFAMNVGGAPSLTITAIEPQADGAVNVTVKGSCVNGATVADAPLGAIHGTLYVTTASTLGGVAKTEKALPVTVAADGSATIAIPADREARFLRARVALAPPADTL